MHEEWNLRTCEAMACGAALVASAIPVRSGYATDSVQALPVEPGAPAAFDAALVRLLLDRALRLRVARAGRERVATLTWPSSARLFDAVLRRRAATGGRGAGADTDV
jgi:glycosyltransferase involved in cell wall biosynthesis